MSKNLTQNLSRALETGNVRLAVQEASAAEAAIKAKLAQLRSESGRLAGARAKAKGSDLTLINAKLGGIIDQSRDLKQKLDGVQILQDKFGPLAEMEFGGNGLVFAPPQAGHYVRIPMYDAGNNLLPAIELVDDGAGGEVGTLQTLDVSWLDVMAVGIEFGRQNGANNGDLTSVAFNDPQVSGGATLLTSAGWSPINAYRMEDTEMAGVRHYARVPKTSNISANVRLESDLINATGNQTVTIFASIIAHIIFDNNFGKLNSPDVRAAFKRALGDVFKIGAGDFVFSPAAPPPGQLERLPMYVETTDSMNTALDNPICWFAAAAGGNATNQGAGVTLINDQNSIGSDFQIVGVEFSLPETTGIADEVYCTQDLRIANGPGLYPHRNWIPTLNYLGREGDGGGAQASRGGLRFYPVLEKSSEVRVDVGIFDASAGLMQTGEAAAAPGAIETNLLVHRLTDPVLGHKYGLSAHGVLLRAAQACGCSF